jgi:hypothetical protein
MDDLEEHVFGTLPDETCIYPGHGDDTTPGRERPSLPDWRAPGAADPPIVPAPGPSDDVEERARTRGVTAVR